QVGATASMELDTADHRRSSGVTSGLHRMLTKELRRASLNDFAQWSRSRHYIRNKNSRALQPGCSVSAGAED
ncbi:hypothetical protein, partial [Rhizobium leguminosarum]